MEMEHGTESEMAPPPFDRHCSIRSCRERNEWMLANTVDLVGSVHTERPIYGPFIPAEMKPAPISPIRVGSLAADRQATRRYIAQSFPELVERIDPVTSAKRYGKGTRIRARRLDAIAFHNEHPVTVSPRNANPVKYNNETNRERALARARADRSSVMVGRDTVRIEDLMKPDKGGPESNVIIVRRDQRQHAATVTYRPNQVAYIEPGKRPEVIDEPHAVAYVMYAAIRNATMDGKSARNSRGGSFVGYGDTVYLTHATYHPKLDTVEGGTVVKRKPRLDAGTDRPTDNLTKRGRGRPRKSVEVVKPKRKRTRKSL